MKKINEQKLQAFAIGAMGLRPLSRREQEEQKKREEEEAAAHAFKEYVEVFQETPSSISKVWVRAGTYDAGSRREDHRDKGKLYRPNSKHDGNSNKSSADKAQEYAKMLASESKGESLTLKKKSQEKKKSNLESFKEELRQIQEEREERYKYKVQISKTVLQAPEPDIFIPKDNEAGSMDNGDPNTTNIYLGNLSPKISENQLMELFGRYGPLASIKIMWPRTAEEKARGRNCGFVAYMSRSDAERALRCLNGREVMSYEMKLGWGRSVPIMTHPIYVPPTLVEFNMPPAKNGLPFNAQPQPSDAINFPQIDYFKNYNTDPEIFEEMNKLSYNCIVKVMIPTERAILSIIHRMIEFVIREGPLFEAMIMCRELENPLFTFLFENESPAHIYYRWKLFSLLQGDTPSEWRQKEFRMFKGGPIWRPPAANFYTKGMPEDLIVDPEAPDINKGALSVAQRDRLEDLIRHLTPERAKIGDAMIFCIEHADAADEICECIEESLGNVKTIISKKVARLYLISDILHNCSVKVANASFFRKALEKCLETIFRDLRECYMALESRIKAEGYKVRVLEVCKAWEDWAIYPRDFLIRLKNTFLGLPMPGEKQPQDIDGAPISGDEKEDEELDGIPLDGAALLKSALLRAIPGSKSGGGGGNAAAVSSPFRENFHRTNDNTNNNNINNRDTDYDDDIDGIPLDEDIDGVPMDRAGGSGGFMPSKWETVDPEQIEAQAITTSKWDTLDPIAPEPPLISHSSDVSNDEDNYDDTENSRDFDEERRTRLREIELKSMQYQDELESGQKTLKHGWTIQQQTEHFRRKLMKKSDKELRDRDTDSPMEKYSSSSSKRDKRSLSPPPTEQIRKSKKNKQRGSRSPSSVNSYGKSSSPPISKHSRRNKSKSPQYTTKKSQYRDSSISPPPPPPPSSSSSSRRSTKRAVARSRSRSDSDSPKRYQNEKKRRQQQSPSPSPPLPSASIRSSSKYDSPAHLKRYRSPSPPPPSSSSYSKHTRYLSPSQTQQISTISSVASSSNSSRSSKRDRLSPERLSRPIGRGQSPVRYVDKSPPRHRSDKHKHKHKY